MRKEQVTCSDCSSLPLQSLQNCFETASIEEWAGRLGYPRREERWNTDLKGAR